MSVATAIKPKERPILFSDPMVRAILEGQKTVTRRVPSTEACVNYDEHHPYAIRDRKALWHTYATLDEFVERRSPYGKPGDVLWVREAWQYTDVGGVGGDLTDLPFPEYQYRATYTSPVYCSPITKWKPSIFMPRTACRLKLRVTDVRVERLQEISDEQCIAEGIELIGGQFNDSPVFKDYSRGARNDATQGDGFGYPRNSFESLWDSINQERGYGRDTNPWVWTVEFERISEETPNAA